MRDATGSGNGYRGTPYLFLAPSRGHATCFKGAVFVSGLITFPGAWSAMPSSCGHRHRTGIMYGLPREKKELERGANHIEDVRVHLRH